MNPPQTPDDYMEQPPTEWERLVWKRHMMITEGNRGSFNVIGVERLSAQIELLESTKGGAR
jgi:hypothetical protein